MAKHDQRAMAPPPRVQPRQRRAAPPPQRHRDEEDDGPRRPLLVYALLSFLVIAMGGFLWNAYDDGPAGGVVRVQADPERFKEPGPDATAPAPAPPPVEDVLRDPEAVADAGETAPAPEEPMVEDANPAPTGAPVFVNNGPFVAQIAALQSEGGIAPLWRRLSERAPDLFAQARMDVQRADLGAAGVFLRVRVGYFADRENAARFCVRMRAMGQDCMAVER